jgi:hypothetical protein
LDTKIKRDEILRSEVEKKKRTNNKKKIRMRIKLDTKIK